MAKKRSTLAALIVDPFREWSKDNASTLAAALAYYAVMSLVPLLVIIVWIAGYVFKTSTALNQLSDQIARFTSPQVGNFVKNLVSNSSKPGQGSLLSQIASIVVLVFGASGIFSQLQSSLNRIWNVPPKNNAGFRRTVKNKFLSFLMVIGLGILFIIFLVADAVISQLIKAIPGQNALVAQIINDVIMFALLTFGIAMVFRVVPDREITWKDVWLGSAVTALLFILGRYAIGIFLSYSKTASSFGAAGSLIVLLLWIYYSAQIFFFGAEFTQVYAENVGSHKNMEAENPEAKLAESLPPTNPGNNPPEVQPASQSANNQDNAVSSDGQKS